MSKKWKWIIGLLFVGVVLGGALAVSSMWVMHKTSETSFCLSCHTMQAPYEEYQGSAHFMNQKGIRAECHDCHIPQSGMDYLITKIRASKDIYHEFVTGKIDTPEKFEEHRLAMAQTVWDQLKANDSATCRSCHQFDAMDLQKQSADAQKMHALGIKEKQTCIDCHKGVAHFPPEITIDSKAHDALMEHARQTPADAKEVYPVAPAPLGNLGTVYPATKLAVVGRSGDAREVEITGSQMQGAEQVIYLSAGQRLVLATLTEEGQKAVKVSSDWEKDPYGNAWRSVSLRAPLAEPALGKPDEIWNYAKTLDQAYCSGCHAPISSEHYTLNAWPSVAKGMGARTDISAEDLDILTRWFQYHAKDIATRE